MSSDPLPTATDLQASIEQLIAAAVQNSYSSQNDYLTTALRETLADIEAQQAALAATAERIRAALAGEIEQVVQSEVPAPVASELQIAPTPIVLNERGPHELDVIAHSATLNHASGLQALLRGMGTVNGLQTRQFVNGELRLHAEMTAAIDIDALTTWLTANKGSLTTISDDVIEIEFAN